MQPNKVPPTKKAKKIQAGTAALIGFLFAFAILTAAVGLIFLVPSTTTTTGTSATLNASAIPNPTMGPGGMMSMEMAMNIEIPPEAVQIGVDMWSQNVSSNHTLLYHVIFPAEYYAKANFKAAVGPPNATAVPDSCCRIFDFERLSTYSMTIYSPPNDAYTGWINEAAYHWNQVLPGQFSSATVSSGIGAMAKNNINEIGFARLTMADQGILGVTYFWVNQDNVLVEWEHCYNVKGYPLCDASVDANCYDAPSVMRHEFGHVVGLNHPTASECSGSLMYPSISRGTIKYIDDASGRCAGGVAGYGGDPGSNAVRSANWFSPANVTSNALAALVLVVIFTL